MNRNGTHGLLRRLFLVVVVGFGQNAVGADFDEYDIVGMRLDMTLDDIHDVLQGHMPPPGRVGMAGGDINGIQDSRLRGLTWENGAVRGSKMGRDITQQEEIWVQGAAPPHLGKVAVIYRQAYFEEPMNGERLTAALVEKYGPVTFEKPPVPHPTNPRWSDYSHVWSWSVTPSGQPITDLNQLAACTGSLNVGVNPHDMKSKALMLSKVSDASTFNGGSTKHCGKILAIAASEDRRGAVRGYYVIMYDMQSIEALNRDTVQYSIAEAQKIQQEREKQLSSAKKPTL